MEPFARLEFAAHWPAGSRSSLFDSRRPKPDSETVHAEPFVQECTVRRGPRILKVPITTPAFPEPLVLVVLVIVVLLVAVVVLCEVLLVSVVVVRVLLLVAVVLLSVLLLL